MRARSSQGAVIGLAIAMTCLGLSCTSSTPSHPRYGFDVAVTPSSEDPTVYETVVTVRDLASGQTVFHPRLLSPAGEPATVEAEDQASGISFKITVEIGVGGKMATYSAELRDAAGAVTTQDARVKLQPS